MKETQKESKMTDEELEAAKEKVKQFDTMRKRFATPVVLYVEEIVGRKLTEEERAKIDDFLSMYFIMCSSTMMML